MSPNKRAYTLIPISEHPTILSKSELQTQKHQRVQTTHPRLNPRICALLPCITAIIVIMVILAINIPTPSRVGEDQFGSSVQTPPSEKPAFTDTTKIMDVETTDVETTDVETTDVETTDVETTDVEADEMLGLDEVGDSDYYYEALSMVKPVDISVTNKTVVIHGGNDSIIVF